jgi:hypothetical protein
VLLDGDDVVPLEEGADAGVDEVWEVEVVVGVVVSDELEVEVGSAVDVEESVGEEVGAADVEEGTGVSLGDVEAGATDGDCVTEGVGEGDEVGVTDGVSGDWALI